jgi:hypothetical protein
MIRCIRHGRFLTWALALALAFVSSLTCFVGLATAAEQQDACCVAMNHDCGAVGTAQNCCVIQSPNWPGILSRVLVSAPPVPALVVRDATPIDLGYSASVTVRFHIRAPASSKPTYLFDSVFRL